LIRIFDYDDQSRLVSVYASADNESFQYDANGNRLMQTGTVDTVSATGNQLACAGGTAYGYDSVGNTMTLNGAAAYSDFGRSHASEGRLRSSLIVHPPHLVYALPTHALRRGRLWR
jgi:hypothetical protein